MNQRPQKSNRAISFDHNVVQQIMSPYHDETQYQDGVDGQVYQGRKCDHTYAKRPDDNELDNVKMDVKIPTEIHDYHLKDDQP